MYPLKQLGRKFMRNLVKSLGLSLVALFALTSCRFNAPTIDEEKNHLTEAGYTVTLTSGEDIDNTNKDTPLYGLIGIEDCLYAQKDDNEIYLMWFSSIELASDLSISTKLRTGQINEFVFAGTKQAIKDAKL